MLTSLRFVPRRRRVLQVPLIAACVASLHASPTGAAWFSTDPTYMGFRIPESRWSYWTAAISAIGGHSAGPAFAGQSHAGSWSGGLSTRLGAGRDSDRLQHLWNLGTGGSGGRGGSRLEDEGFGSTYERDERRRSLSERVGAQGSLRIHPWTVPLGLSLSTAHNLDLSQTFTSSDVAASNTSFAPPERFRSTTSTGQGSRRYIGTGDAGIRFGRVRYVTPVYQAQVLESRLLESGALTRPLSDQARNQLAALYAVEPGMSFAHERTSKYFWRELERILREDGALAEGSLGAWDVLRLQERLYVGGGLPRYAGFSFGPGIAVATVRDRRTMETSTSIARYVADTLYSADGFSRLETVNTRLDDVFVMFAAELHRPLDARWQLDAYSSVSIREAGEFPGLVNSFSLGYHVADRWYGNVQVLHYASGYGHSRRFDQWSAQLRADLIYFVEDDWALSLKADEGQSHDAAGLRRNGGFQLGVTWIVSGLFEAPGLVGPMRPAPPAP